MFWQRRAIAGAAIALLVVLVVAATVFAASAQGLWLMSGQNLQNTRYQSEETKLDVKKVGKLAVRWQFTTGGDVSATAAVDKSNVYVPDWAGNLSALNRNSGKLVWQHQIAEYTGVAGDFVRTTPFVAGKSLVFGDQGGRMGAGAWVMAVSTDTGQLLWKTHVDDHPTAVITQSAVVAAGIVYVGVSSVEESAATDPNYVCCTFRGSMLALDAGDGHIIWKTYIVPEGYSGGAVWGSTPVVDGDTVYIGTGNNYTLPPEVQQCVANAAGDGNAVQACL